MMNSFSFSLSENLLISSSFWKNGFAVYTIIHGKVFFHSFFHHFNMSLHCLLTSMVFDEKLAVNCIEDPLHMVNFIYFTSLKILSVFDF